MNAETQAKINKIRKSQNMVALSAFIQVGMSDLYDYVPVKRAVLKEIAFMQMTEADSKYPEDAPEEFKADRIGWCWASQETLADRVGCAEKYVFDCVKEFVIDGVIETRDWVDSNNTPHKEYHVLEDMVQAHQRVKGGSRKRKTSRVYKKNKGSFKPKNQEWKKRQPMNSQPHPDELSADALMNSQPIADELSADQPMNSQPCESAESAVKGVIQGVTLRASGGLDLGVSTQDGITASSVADAPGLSPAAHRVPFVEGQVKTSKSLGSLAEQDQNQKRPAGTITAYNHPNGQPANGEKRPRLVWKSIPEVAKYCDSKGNWKGGKLLQCRKCGGRLYPQEYHVSPDFDHSVDYAALGYDTCPGFIPLEDERHPQHVAPMGKAKKVSLDDDGIDTRPFRKPSCNRCGTVLHSEDHAAMHDEECSGIMSL